MRRVILTSVVAIMSASAVGNAVSQDMFDWSGFYVGGAIGVVQSDSHADLVYGTDTEAITSAWSSPSGFFTGAIYDAVDGSDIDLNSNDPDENYTLSLAALTPWLTELELSELAWAGMGFAGAQVQMGGFVLGAEGRGIFGSFGNSFSDSWSDEVTDLGSISDPEGGVLTAGLPAIVVDGDWSGDNAVNENLGFDDLGAIHGGIDQDSALSFGTSYDSVFAPVAKLGVAADRFMVFGMVGPSVAEVTATTAASVDETGHIGVSADGNSVADVEGFASYDWSGSNTETLWGYTIGAGVEFAATDNMILRLEGSMTDLGSIDVVGQSADTAATYTVTQTVANFSLMSGVSLKF